jgi:hypothetical protein
VPDPQVLAEAWEAWRAEVNFAEQFVARALSLDVTGSDQLKLHGSGGGPMSLREALVGMIWEYGRHMVHADLLRERIDGRIRPVTHQPYSHPGVRNHGCRGYWASASH